jgi:hypothetical protein
MAGLNDDINNWQQWGTDTPLSNPASNINSNLGGMGTDPLSTKWADMGAYGKMGVVSQGLGAFSSLAQIYAGFKAMKLAKDQFKFQKEAWNKNYQAGVKDYENTLKDKWAARSASAAARGTDFQSMSSYVDPRKIDKTVTAPTG